MQHQVVWVDIPVRDLGRAIGFYSAVLGAPVSLTGGPGFSFGLLPHADTNVSGCLYVPEADNAPSLLGPLVYLNVAGRMAEALTAVGSHGGSVLQPAHPIGPHGWRALIMDTEGNRLALHSPTK